MEGRKKYLRLNDIEAYRLAFYLSNLVWDEVVQWVVSEQDSSSAEQ